jgi:hypothetical protein
MEPVEIAGVRRLRNGGTSTTTRKSRDALSHEAASIETETVIDAPLWDKLKEKYKHG